MQCPEGKSLCAVSCCPPSRDQLMYRILREAALTSPLMHILQQQLMHGSHLHRCTCEANASAGCVHSIQQEQLQSTCLIIHIPVQAKECRHVLHKCAWQMQLPGSKICYNIAVRIVLNAIKAFIIACCSTPEQAFSMSCLEPACCAPAV